MSPFRRGMFGLENATQIHGIALRIVATTGIFEASHDGRCTQIDTLRLITQAH